MNLVSRFLWLILYITYLISLKFTLTLSRKKKRRKLLKKQSSPVWSRSYQIVSSTRRIQLFWELMFLRALSRKIEELELKKKQQETKAIETSRKVIPSMEKCKKQLMIANSDFMEKMEDKFLNLVSKLEENDKAIATFMLSAEQFIEIMKKELEQGSEK